MSQDDSTSAPGAAGGEVRPNASPYAFAEVVPDSSGGGGIVRISGRLDATGVAAIWDGVFLRVKPLAGFQVDASGVEYCDGAGLGLLLELKRLVPRGAAGAVEFRGLPKEVSELLERATPTKEPEQPPPPLGAVTQLGAGAASVGRDLAALVAFLGEMIAAFAWGSARPSRVRWRDVLLVCEKAGAMAVPVVCLLGFLMGLIIAFQAAAPLAQYGAQGQIPNMLAFAMVRELGPLVTAVILAGRSGSAFAAEIGTMKVTEEINALTTFGLDPVRFLVVPRVLAAMIIMPLLSNFCTLMGLLGGLPTIWSFGYGTHYYMDAVRDAVGDVDLIQGLIKSVVFAFLVAGVGCKRGLATGAGPGAVGNSTTSAVVAGIVLIVVADGVLGAVFYYAGV
jgi:phospholipid/cholesterol/gamma-HCH transport system permease protein